MTGEMDPLTAVVVSAFQRHFRPARVDGRLDTGTMQAIAAAAAAAYTPNWY
jgi:N-acetylmuramoyl-L-alanine amidase